MIREEDPGGDRGRAPDRPPTKKELKELIEHVSKELHREVAYVKKLKARLKRTFNAFIGAFEKCERIDRRLSKLEEELAER